METYAEAHPDAELEIGDMNGENTENEMDELDRDVMDKDVTAKEGQVNAKIGENADEGGLSQGMATEDGEIHDEMEEGRQARKMTSPQVVSIT